MLHMELCFDWPSGFKGEGFEIVDDDGRTTGGRTDAEAWPLVSLWLSGMMVLHNESWICGKRNAYDFAYHVAIFIDHPLHLWVKCTTAFP